MTSRWVYSLVAAAVLLLSSIPASASGGFGLTFAKTTHDSTNGTDQVGCAGCYPYTGDTSCSNSLPILCYKYDGSPVPSGLTPSFYNGWKYGHIAVTPPVQGFSLTSLATANNICQYYFGAGYEMAEFHHNWGGWYWWAYGNVRSDYRFWTYINDQPGNCWD
jgi:hypothetical protein